MGRATSRPINQLALITRRKLGRYGTCPPTCPPKPLAKGEALGEGGGHPSLKNDLALGGLQSLAADGVWPFIASSFGI